MLVRAAVADDVPGIVGVFAAVAEEGLIATEPSFDRERRAAHLRDAISEPGAGGLWVVVNDPGRVVGMIGTHETAARGVLSLGMAIESGWRRRGGGAALLETALEAAWTSGAHKVELEVWPDNERAIRFYERAGFEREGLRRHHYRRDDGSVRATVLMAAFAPGLER